MTTTDGTVLGETFDYYNIFSNSCKLIWEYGFEVYWRVACCFKAYYMRSAYSKWKCWQSLLWFVLLWSK